MNINAEIRKKLTITNEIFLAKYLCFVETNKCDSVYYSEKHHILPKHIWPEYENFSQHPWNMVTLTLHDHLLAHYYFSMATNALWNAIPAIAYLTANGARQLTDNDIDLVAETMEYYKQNCRGENHPRHGTTHTEETKKKISNANKGNVWDESRKVEHSKKLKGKKKPEGFAEKCRQAKTGTTHTDETKKKMSESRKGRKLTQEWKDNISKANKGKVGTPHTQEFKDQLSARRVGDNNPMFGRTQSSETKQKMKLKKAETLKAKWGELYEELYTLWISAGKCSAYRFEIWLEQHSDYRFTSSKLSSLIRSYSN